MTYTPPKLTIPMHIRKINPMGYVHGQINNQGIKHPGYDLNDGGNAWADLGQEMVAPGDSLIVYAGKDCPGFGTLIVGLLSEKQIDPVTGKLVWLGWRLGHPKDIYVKVGDRVRGGQVVGTCGNGGNADMTPHAHFDMFRREEMEKLIKTGFGWDYWDSKKFKRDNFSKLYVDAQRYFPEIDRVIPG